MSPRMVWRTGAKFDPEVEARYVVPGTSLPLYRVVLVARRTAIGAFLAAVAAGVLLFTAPSSTSGRALLGVTIFVGAVGIGMVATLAAMVAGVARGVMAARAAFEAQRRSQEPVASAIAGEHGEDTH